MHAIVNNKVSNTAASRPESGQRAGRHTPEALDSAALLTEVRYWDQVIEHERGRSGVEVLARLEEQRAWAVVRLLNLVGQPGAGGPRH